MGRGHRSEDDEDVEMGSDREGDTGGDREDRRSHKRSKKSKKSKKSKSRRRSRSRSPLNDDRSSKPLEDGEFNDEDTDKEGGSTPEYERNGKSQRSSRGGGRKSSRKSPGQASPPPPRAASPVSENEGGKTVTSLSVEETNKLRAKLGLKPLQVDEPKPVAAVDDDGAGGGGREEDGTLIAGDADQARHKPAENLTQKKEEEKMRDRLQKRKDKRKQESKLSKVKQLGDSDSEEDSAKAFVKKQKAAAKAKEMAMKRAKMLEEMDDAFGVDDLIKKEPGSLIGQKKYTEKSLRGLKVEHDADKFEEGKSVILTLKDADVLGEDQDTLVNVNVVDQEKLDKKISETKKARVGYNKYDIEDVDMDTGEMEKKNLLYKYDEELEGEKKKSFTLGQGGAFSQEEEARRKREEIRAKLANKNMVSLATDNFRTSSDYMTAEEAEAKFKKPKKKKKKKQMLKADDLLGTADYDGVAIGSRLPKVVEAVEEDSGFISKALMKTKKPRKTLDVTDQLTVQAPKSVLDDDESRLGTSGAEFITTFSDDVRSNDNIILNETSEFCRNLGAWQTSGRGRTGVREQDEVAQEILDFEDSLKTTSNRRESTEMDMDSGDEGKTSNWAEVGRSGGTSDDGFLYDRIASGESGEASASGSGAGSSKKKAAVLDDEPDLAKSGLASALQMARNKGYIETNEQKSTGLGLKHLQAKNYSVDDKVRDDDRGRRGRRGDDDRYGSTSSFQEKKGYKPNVELTYMDDTGRMMNQKEAFRYLSHKFHGKGSGKIKTEKRMKKIMEEGSMRNMSSTDTPLNTLQKLKSRQAETATPYLILTGNKNNATDVTELRK